MGTPLCCRRPRLLLRGSCKNLYAEDDAQNIFRAASLKQKTASGCFKQSLLDMSADVWVDNAGIALCMRCNVPEATEESFNHMLNVNLRGTVFLPKHREN